MKLISFVVPCYNSQEYMRHCIDTLLPGGDQVEILIVNDGSSDNTAAIADEYEKKYPDICRAIHQENKGHGGAVNFYKQGTVLDMLLSNYVYEKQGVKKKTVIHYRHAIPKDQIFCWDDVGRFPVSQYILMHSVIYRTALLHECDLELPEHTFYVDNIYVFKPLPYVKTMYYLDVNFYRYFIGRDDQSVNETNMIKRIDQQFKVTYIMIDYMTQFNLVSKPLERYMRHYLSIIMCISSVISVKSGQKEHLKMRKELWKYLYDSDKRLYRKIRHNITSCAVNLPGYVGRKATIAMYKAARRFIGFN